MGGTSRDQQDMSTVTFLLNNLATIKAVVPPDTIFFPSKAANFLPSISSLDFSKGDGLIPAIAQDWKTGEVLMLAYINQESWEETLKSGCATYWTRSRQKLWKKGESSGNVQEIKEILVNLLENACDAMNNGGEIIICAKQGVVEPLGHVVVMTVKDNGPGIPEELQDKIFQPFFSAKEEGTGLGLSIAKRIIEDHGGWISVSSKPEEGTTFTITLPCGRA